MKSTPLNSKRVILVAACLGCLEYLPKLMVITQPYVQAVLIAAMVFLVLSAVLSISWSEKGLDVIKEVAGDAFQIPKALGSLTGDAGRGDAPTVVAQPDQSPPTPTPTPTPPEGQPQ